MPPSTVSRRTNYSKLIAMIIFLSADLGLNSILDYDLFNNQTTTNNTTHLLLGLLGLQTVIEISTFLILFVAMADTFLFRVGLLGLLMKKFRTVLLFQPIYIAITIASGSLRVRHLSVPGNSLYTLYQYNAFISISLVQKIGKFWFNAIAKDSEYLVSLRCTHFSNIVFLRHCSTIFNRTKNSSVCFQVFVLVFLVLYCLPNVAITTVIRLSWLFCTLLASIFYFILFVSILGISPLPLFWSKISLTVHSTLSLI